jgi:peptidyl-prolyl cis-trans isomerase C
MAGERSADVAAIVNGAAITRQELQRETVRRQRMAKSSDTADKIRAAALDQLIVRELLLQEARRAGAPEDSAAVEAELTSMRTRFADDKAFRKELAALGYTVETLRTDLAKGMTVRRFLAGQRSADESSDAELREYYDNHRDEFIRPEQVRAGHLHIEVNPGASWDMKQEALTLIRKLRADLEAGADFAAIARTHSACPSRERGGDLGFFGRGMLQKPLDDAAFALPVGALSGVIETGFGYHILKIIEKTPAGTIPFNEVKEQVQDAVRKQGQGSEVGRIVSELRSKAKIEIITGQSE